MHILSFGCKLVPVPVDHFVRDHHLLRPSPEVFMSPRMPHLQEVDHWKHWKEDSSRKWLSSDHWEEKEHCWRRGDAILEGPVLIPVNPIEAVLQIILGNGTDFRVSYQEVDELSPWLPGGAVFPYGLLVECIGHFLAVGSLHAELFEEAICLLDGVVPWLQNTWTKWHLLIKNYK